MTPRSQFPRESGRTERFEIDPVGVVDIDEAVSPFEEIRDQGGSPLERPAKPTLDISRKEPEVIELGSGSPRLVETAAPWIVVQFQVMARARKREMDPPTASLPAPPVDHAEPQRSIEADGPAQIADPDSRVKEPYA